LICIAAIGERLVKIKDLFDLIKGMLDEDSTDFCIKSDIIKLLWLLDVKLQTIISLRKVKFTHAVNCHLLLCNASYLKYSSLERVEQTSDSICQAKLAAACNKRINSCFVKLQGEMLGFKCYIISTAAFTRFEHLFKALFALLQCSARNILTLGYCRQCT